MYTILTRYLTTKKKQHITTTTHIYTWKCDINSWFSTHFTRKLYVLRSLAFLLVCYVQRRDNCNTHTQKYKELLYFQAHIHTHTYTRTFHYNLNHNFFFYIYEIHKYSWNANNNNFVIRNSIRCNHNNHRQDHSL